ncbi:MAG: hypothetical protein K6A36_08280, partial [Paludibacteraceae bacterium]|nr:hypothetical protein [Paludibacteraceae bacterium]
MLVMLLALALSCCTERPYIDAPGDNSHNQDSLPQLADPTPTPDPEGFALPEGVINVNEAVKIAKKLSAGEVSKNKYLIKGWVTNYDDKEHGKTDFETNFKKYGNEYIHLSARQDGEGTKEFYAYRVLGKFGAKLPDHESVKPGDFVVISCYLTNYNGVYESSGACFIYDSNNAHFGEVFPEFPGCPAPGEGELSVTEAEAEALKLESKATSQDDYRVRGVVTSVETTVLGSYGNINFNISDGLSYATCYQTYCKTATGKFTNLNQVVVGDTVLVVGKIQNYNGTCEPYRAYVAESTNPNF